MAVATRFNRSMSKAVVDAAHEINPALTPLVIDKKRSVADFEHHSISARLILDQLQAQPVQVSPERFAELKIAVDSLHRVWKLYAGTWHELTKDVVPHWVGAEDPGEDLA